MSAWQKKNNKARGVPMSAETKIKIATAKKGIPAPWAAKPLSPEIKAKMAATKLANSWTCPHCTKSGKGVGTATRWHFNNCKFKETDQCSPV